MRRRPFWTENDKEAQRAEDEKNKGRFAELIGCGGEGCFIVATPALLVAAFWYFG